MRLSNRTQNIIGDSVKVVFGTDATVRLFGSRINDTARGGDIGLYIETDAS